MAVDVSESQQDDVLIVKISGRLDAASSPVLEQKIGTVLEGGHTKLVINFDQVDYLSSAGMRLLITVSKKLQEKGGKVALACVHDSVMEVITMAGFDKFLTTYPSESAAVGSF